MTEITRVPLLPIARGSIPKLWLGVFVAMLGAAAIAKVGAPPLVDIETVTPGTGASPGASDFVMINYTGKLADGKVFDSGQRVVLPVGQNIPGFTRALEQMQVGGKYIVKIPAALAYGEKGTGPIPGNADLTFSVDLLDYKTAAEIEAQQRLMEQLRAMQSARGGAAAGGAGGPADASQGAPAGAPPQE